MDLINIIEYIQQVDEEYAEYINGLGNDDIERNHSNADDILLDIIRTFGFNKTADAFENLDKWYA